MRHAAPAQVVERLGRLQTDEQRLGRGERHTGLDEALQTHRRSRIDEVGHGVELPVQQRQDVKVPQVAQFLQAGRGVIGVGHRLGGEERHLDVLVAVRVLRPVGPPEPALTQVVADPVTARHRGGFPGRLAGLARGGFGRLLVDAVAWVLLAGLAGSGVHEGRDYRRGRRADRL